MQGKTRADVAFFGMLMQLPLFGGGVEVQPTNEFVKGFVPHSQSQALFDNVCLQELHHLGLAVLPKIQY